MRSGLRRIIDSLDRGRDRPVRRPVNLRHGADDTPPAPEMLTLALQQLAIQASYWVLPLLVARAFGADAATSASFVATSLLGVAIATFAQSWSRGPIGSGYSVPLVPSPVSMPIYLGAAAAGLGLGAASAAMATAFLAATLLVVAMPKVLRLLSTEICGVVLFGVGLGFVPIVLGLLAPLFEGTPQAPSAAPSGLAGPNAIALATFVGSIVLQVGIGLIRGPLSPYGLLTAAIAGTLAIHLTIGLDAGALRTLDDAQWLALPTILVPEFSATDSAAVAAAFVAALSMLSVMLGNLVAVQREQDAEWTRPDLPPLQRGLMTHGLATTTTVLAGSMPPSPCSAGVALSIATRSLSRRTIQCCAGLAAAISLCPKMVALMLTIPDAVVAALLLVVGGWLMCAGLKLITVRTMDARRTSCVGLGLFAGITAIVEPGLVGTVLAAPLAGPATLAFIVAFGLHLVTLPLVKRDLGADLRLDGNVGAEVDAFVARAAGAWGLRSQTANAMTRALLEIGELLTSRGLAHARVQAETVDGRIRVVLHHRRPALPEPSAQPIATDLEHHSAGEAFAMWMACRAADDVRIAAERERASVTLTFVD